MILEKKFNENLSEKFSNELNNQRQRFLNRISSQMSFELSHAEILSKSGENKNEKTVSKEFKNIKKFKFKRSLIKSYNLGIWKLLINEFKNA